MRDKVKYFSSWKESRRLIIKSKNDYKSIKSIF